MRRRIPVGTLGRTGMAHRSPPPTPFVRAPSRRGVTALAVVVLIGTLAACGITADEPTAQSVAPTVTPSAPPPGTPSTTTAVATGPEMFDHSLVHEISAVFDDVAYREMIDTFAATGDKEWIEATVTLDGVSYDQVGMRLKGSSSLSALRNDVSASSDATGDAAVPETLPWLIRLDRFDEDQHHQGLVDLVVRPNASTTALNEAVALELLDVAGLATQKAVATGFSVNGSDPVLRLVIEHPDDVWMAENFGADGALYKSEAEGDWSDRGDDPDTYDDVFDQEAGDDTADLDPLIDLIEFLDSSDDARFAAELPTRLDIEAFATYLAAQDLISNHDDIDGRGNNSYLYLDPATGRFTVVAWDHNLAFGAFGALPPGSGPGALGGSNVLADRFHAEPEFEARYQEKLTALRTRFYDEGAATEILDHWVTLLQTEAADLVDPTVVTEEAAVITPYFGIGP